MGNVFAYWEPDVCYEVCARFCELGDCGGNSTRSFDVTYGGV